MFRQTDDYIGDIDYDSDGICRASDSNSDDERNSAHEADSTSESDFETEMNRGLDETIRWMASPHFKSGHSPPGRQSDDAASASAEKPDDVKYYDDVYFSSGSSDEGGGGEVREAASATPPARRRRRVPIPSNDDLLYDPSMDDEDERWVLRQREKYSSAARPPPGFEKHGKKRGSDAKSRSSDDNATEREEKPLQKSDAVLNCPSCMSLLCLDCQRHERYETQYRAMFVVNCNVVPDEVLRYKGPLKGKSRKRRKRRQGSDAGTDRDVGSAVDRINKGEEHEEEEDVYKPVKCSTCSTEVAVCDNDEVYHFFNVLASAP